VPKEFHLPEWLHFQRGVRKKSPACLRAFSYLLTPEPGPVGVNVEPLGEVPGPIVLPEGFILLLGPLAEPGVVPEVLPLPLMVLPLPLPVVPLEVLAPAVPPPPAAPPPPPPPAPCASANAGASAIPVASITVVSFIIISSLVERR
jgi:hypothetical protein